jgi:antitoxin ParD1/3/4
MHISLTPELKKFVKQKVDSGLYINASEVIRDALRQMNRYESFFYDLKRKHLISLLEEGERSGLSDVSVSDIIEQEKKSKG